MAKDQTNPLELSDDEFMKADPEDFMNMDEEENSSADDNEDEDSNSDDDDNNENDSDDDNDDSQEDENQDQNQNNDDDENNSTNQDTDQDTDKDDKEEKNTDSSSTEDKDINQQQQNTDTRTGELTDSQYVEIGKQVMSEFKANGRTIKIKSADDAIQLMQMGANYHKKMSGLKPSLKTLKLLENNDLLDPEKINYLIDLNQRKPEAIKQLLKDSKLDPMELDLDTNEETYKPSQRTVSDTAIDLDVVLDSISESPQYDRTLTVLGDEWDDASRQSIGEKPELIRTINNHMESGIYDQVADAVEYERSLGRLSGISDLEAYQQIGSYMHENNLFTGVSKQNQQVDNNAQQDHNSDTQSQNNNDTQQKDQQRQNRKKAASPSRHRQANSSKGDKGYNPLAMSDEEFLKLNDITL